jgi:hypothetical protein
MFRLNKDGPVLTGGVLFLPLREVIEGFGGKDRWDGASMTASPLLDGKTGRVTVGFTHGVYISESGSVMVPADYFRQEHDIQNSFDLETGQITLTKETENAAVQNAGPGKGAAPPALVWASSNPNIAAVDQNGLVTAVNAGTVTVCVTETDGRGGYTIEAARVTVQSMSKEPRALVTTFSGCPKTERAFTWYTHAPMAQAVVETDSGQRFIGATEVFDTKCAAGTDHGVRYVHKVRLKNLTPGTAYQYRAGDGETWSQTGTFTTENEREEPFTFLVLTDPQGSAEDHYIMYGKTLRAGLERFPESRFIVMGGDAVEEGNREDWWDFYFDYAQPHVSGLPLMSVVGNHETRGGGVKNFNRHFLYPDNGRGLSAGLTCGEYTPENILEMDNTVYSFDYANAHFAFLNTGSSRDGKTNPAGFLEAQRDWLINDMKGTSKRWKIVVLHRPVYGSKDDEPGVREVFAECFETLGVDLVLQGHDHVYMRTDPAKTPVYMIAGASGRKLYEYKEQPWVCKGGAVTGQVCAGIRVDSEKIEVKVYALPGDLIDRFTV